MHSGYIDEVTRCSQDVNKTTQDKLKIAVSSVKHQSTLGTVRINLPIWKKSVHAEVPRLSQAASTIHVANSTIPLLSGVEDSALCAAEHGLASVLLVVQ